MLLDSDTTKRVLIVYVNYLSFKYNTTNHRQLKHIKCHINVKLKNNIIYYIIQTTTVHYKNSMSLYCA